ncbi:hypothetical protein [Catelliglobosispora koreensis]|uniref:hypothetical protein n=1 Tax=Catelliglobosispora koreensis TaxID=129052 RepID=UPI001FDF1450|nr:hypothetical protein [Catelliglobosispora koreensis]
MLSKDGYAVGSLELSPMGGKLSHVYWIGGGSGGGKSTMTRKLAARYGLRPYVTDEVMSDHARRGDPSEAPLLQEFIAMDMDERWLNRSPQTMLDTFHWFHGELFDLIADDLREFPPHPRVIAEGFRLLPHLVKPLLPEPHHAVWLIPTHRFRAAAFESRGSLWNIAGRTSDPEKALQNLFERDRMFTEHLAAQVRALDLPLIEVDITMSEDELTERVAESLRLG